MYSLVPRIEYASNNKSSCYKCSYRLLEGELRLGIPSTDDDEVQSMKLDDQKCRSTLLYWFHVECISIEQINTILSLVSGFNHLFGLDKLSAEDRNDVVKLFSTIRTSKKQTKKPEIVDFKMQTGENIYNRLQNTYQTNTQTAPSCSNFAVSISPSRDHFALPRYNSFRSESISPFSGSTAISPHTDSESNYGENANNMSDHFYTNQFDQLTMKSVSPFPSNNSYTYINSYKPINFSNTPVDKLQPYNNINLSSSQPLNSFNSNSLNNNINQTTNSLNRSNSSASKLKRPRVDDSTSSSSGNIKDSSGLSKNSSLSSPDFATSKRRKQFPQSLNTSPSANRIGQNNIWKSYR
jgi:hypothetical protein